MIDIYFVNTIFNIIWYIFSILFVLYKFTSFFSYIYNFGKFLGQLTQGAFYIKDRVFEFTEQRRNQYITRPQAQQPSQSFFTRIKNKIKYYIWGEPTTTTTDIELPLYTRVSDISFKPQRKKTEDSYFENCINELMTESNVKNSFVSIDINNSNYESYYDTNCPTSKLCNSDSEHFIKKDIISEPQIINVENDEPENVKEKFNIQDSNMLFNSNFIKNVFNS
jgi:hypothetical protein